MRCTTCPASLVFPMADGTALSAHNYERDVIVPAAHPRRYHDAPPKERQKGDSKRDNFGIWMQRTAAP